MPIDSINMRSAISERCVRFSWLRKCSPAAQPLKPVGGEIAFCAIESSVASFGLRLTSRREASDDSPCRVSPPHRTRNGSAVTKGHEKVWVEFRRFGKFGRLSILRVCIFKLPKPSKPLNLLSMRNNFRGCACGAREYLQSPNMVRLGLCFLIVRSIKIGTSCIAPLARPRKLLWRQIADAIHDEPIRY